VTLDGDPRSGHTTGRDWLAWSQERHGHRGGTLMGMMDKAKEMRDKVAQSGKPEEYVDKAKDAASKATGHKFDDKIDKGSEATKNAMNKGRNPEQQQ
jgi:hypothetical protein